MPLPVSLPQILEAHGRTLAAGMHTSLPGVVQAYYAASQTVDVRPMVKEVWYDDDDVRHEEELPIVQGVPVAWPRGGGFMLTFPIAAGDEVTLVFAESSTGEFRSTGQVSAPVDLNRHGMGSAIAIPCGSSDKSNLSTASATKVVIGKDGGSTQIQIDGSNIVLGVGATDYAALASKVDQAIAALVAAGSSHTHTYATYPSGTAVTTAVQGAANSQPSVAATIVKVK